MAVLEPKTIQMFDSYLREVDQQMTARAQNPTPLSGLPTGVFPQNAGKDVHEGLVHDWAAVAFLPGVTRAKAIGVLEDFGRHASIYPEVVAGRVDSRQGNQVFGFHRIRKKKVLEVNLEVKYQLDVLPSPPNRYVSRSRAKEIVEVDNAGTKNERRLTPGHDHGFLWRLQTYWTLEETPKGLWMEVRSVSLTRDVPTGLGWMVKPIVRDLPRESLESLMDATKRALLAGQ